MADRYRRSPIDSRNALIVLGSKWIASSWLGGHIKHRSTGKLSDCSAIRWQQRVGKLSRPLRANRDIFRFTGNGAEGIWSDNDDIGADELGLESGCRSMRLNRPSGLGRTVEAKAINRSVKVAYLVPFDDTPSTHMTLDAVFYESYTRWAGMYTLIVPTRSQGLLDNGYDEWLRYYDPDFIYSYVDLDVSLIAKLDRLCCPIALLKHRNRVREDREVTWRTLIPDFQHYIQPVSSISMIQSPGSYPQMPHEDRVRELTVFTQYGVEPYDRFFADNFGTAFDLYNVTNPVSGFFKTLCLVPPDLSANVRAGSEHTSSPLDAFRAISERKVVSIAHLSMVNSAGIPRPESMNWAYAFRLFIGSCPLDRIHFWNSRHLGSNWGQSPGAIILDPTFFDDDQLVNQLGQYLNRNNFHSRSGGGQYQCEIHSSSLGLNELGALRDKLVHHTYNSVFVSRTFNAPAIPNKEDLSERIHTNNTDVTTLKLTEDSNEITASEPEHFIYIPPQFRGLVRGQWIVELSIERHNNLSKYSNVVDLWELPRRRKIASAFTERLAKPTRSGRLALVPSSGNIPLRRNVIKDRSFYDIQLPSDESFFRHLALDFFRYPSDDMRAQSPTAGYIDLAVSDKGQNLRGVISLFDHLTSAFAILTNKFWRTVLAEAKEDSTRPLTFSLDKLESLLPNDRKTLQRLTSELRFDNEGTTKQYLRSSFKDTLEHLVRSKVFFQVAHWRCRYCGHLNSRSFDSMKVKNECEICSTEFLAPIEIEWQYEMNDFVYRSLSKHNGLPVLWALGFLLDRLVRGSFWYLPEVDLFENDDVPRKNNEIDILCMLDGAFHAIEAKRSVSSFLNKDGEVNKFVKVVEMLQPDVALLAFERYCVEEEDSLAMRVRLEQTASHIRERLGPWITLNILVAQDDGGFNDFPADLGWYGRRVREFD